EKGVEVKRNGTPVPKSLWGVSEPVDPGEYLIEAHAAGRKSWSTRVRAEPGRATAVILPPLEESASAPMPPTPSREASASPSGAPPRDSSALPGATSSRIRGQKLAALVVGGAGIIAAGIGAAFAFSANSTYDSANTHCNPDNFCDPQGIDARNT